VSDAELLAMFNADKMFEPEFEVAVSCRETETAGCSNGRLAELLELASAIDCYYGPQSSFLSRCALEAAERLRAIQSTHTPCVDSTGSLSVSGTEQPQGKPSDA
jgi:hypothetical protein